MSCKYYDNTMEFQINPRPKIVPCGDFDMNKIVYNTQGQLVSETQRQKHIRQFADQCKDGGMVDRNKFSCPKTCNNALSVNYVKEKIVGE